ncbi:MAG: hypothetical protein J5966_05830 [Lachnospiraceae bacterium]|nr:hypothetical protein [Lachnospiraceae bacterium]
MAEETNGIKKAAEGGNYNRDKKKAVLNPAPAFNFALQVEAAFFVPLKSVRVFTKENEFDYYQEGGLNDYVHMLRKPISKPFTFQVERYVGVSSGGYFNSGFLDPLTLGTDLVLPLVLYVNRAPRESWDSISFNNCARAYIFTGCTVISKEFGELNSEQSRLATETTTISYREMFTMNQVDPSLESGAPWDIKTGNNAHNENRQAGLASKADQEKKGKEGKWEMVKDVPGGNKKFHTQDKMSKDGKPEGEVYGKNDSKKKGEERGLSELWGYDGTVQGKGKSHPLNRNINKKKEPVIYPPTRRALKADALSRR